MAILTDLANELIIGIWSYLIEPKDVESFALVSKRTHSLSTPFVREHTDLKQRYSKICVEEMDVAPADLLEQMLLNPRIAFYVREFQILYYETERTRWGIRKAYSKHTMAVLEHAIRTSAFIPDTDIEDWITDVKKGNEEPILALIIVKLTKMETFMLLRPAAIGGRYLLDTLNGFTQSSHASVPSRQSVVGAEFNANNRFASTRTSAFSAVNNLTISSRDIDFDVLSRLLQRIPELKTFVYSSKHPSEFEVSKIRDELLRYFQHTLQMLYIRDCSTAKSPIGEITQFKVLRVLGIDFVVLLGSTHGTCNTLGDVLTVSIERVTLYSKETYAFKGLKRVILEMIKSKKERLPRLQAVTFDFDRFEYYNTQDHFDLIEEFHAKSADVGVLLEVIGI